MAYNSRLNSVTLLHTIKNDKDKKVYQQIISTGYSLSIENEVVEAGKGKRRRR